MVNYCLDLQGDARSKQDYAGMADVAPIASEGGLKLSPSFGSQRRTAESDSFGLIDYCSLGDGG